MRVGVGGLVGSVGQVFFLLSFVDISCLDAFTRRGRSCFLRAVRGNRDLCSVSDVCKIDGTSVVQLGPNYRSGVCTKRTVGVPRGGATRGNRAFRAVRPNRALCQLAAACGISTGTVYSTGPKLDTRGFHVKRIVHVPSTTRTVSSAMRTMITTPSRPTVRPTIGPHYGSVRGIGHERAVFDIDHRCNVSRRRLVTTGPRLGGNVGGKRFLYVPCPSRGPAIAIPGASTGVVPPDSDRLFHRGGRIPGDVSAVGTTLLLPFSSGQVMRCCRNFLVTISDLGHAKASVSLCMCSYGGRDSSLGDVLTGDRVGGVGIVFNPTRRRRVGPLTTFTGGGSVHLIVPFSSGRKRMFGGPFVCRVGAPRSCLCSRMCRRFAHRFPGTGIVLLRSTIMSGSGMRFVGNLGRRLKDGNVPMGALGRGTPMRALGTTLRGSGRGFFVPASNGSLALLEVVPRLALLIESGPRTHVRLFNCPR